MRLPSERRATDRSLPPSMSVVAEAKAVVSPAGMKRYLFEDDDDKEVAVMVAQIRVEVGQT